MKKIILLLFTFLPALSFAQIFLKIAQIDSLKYGVYYRSTIDANPPFNMINTFHISIKASSGTLEINSVESHIGNWEGGPIIRSPQEAPEYDYLSFNHQGPIRDMTLKIGHEDLLFTFTTKLPVIGNLYLMDKDDPFAPPNSVSVNLGILINIVGMYTNAFSGIYTSSEEMIRGFTFWDENKNGIRDSIERIISDVPIEISPSATFSYTDEEGYFRFYVEKDISYNINLLLDDCWQLSSDSSDYMFSITESMPMDLGFGLQLAADDRHTQSRITSAPTRCGFMVPFNLSVKNDGCLPENGQFGLVLSPLTTLIDTEIEPAKVLGDTLLWNYDELFASEIQDLRLTFEIAGTDFIGELINMTGLSYIEDELGNLNLSSIYNYSSEIRCAYDPNDKLVQPNRLQQYSKNYTLFEETLEYTIRFQNTGNDTAFNVVLRDTLNKNLDWTTLRPVIASHQYETFLNNKDGALEFSFTNILLPDSTTNEPLSHGFVTYEISPKQGLPENTTIENTASIYFDFNPPIVTNTTQNEMVSELPKTTPCIKGASCDDGDPNTTGTVYDANCNCTDTDIVKAKVFLEGYYDSTTSQMNTQFQEKNLFPLNQPFNTTPWNYTGTERAIQIPTEAVDWVLLVLRNNNGSILNQATGFINQDGELIDIEGNKGIFLSGALDNYISIHPRGHLAIISSSPYTGSMYDFTTSSTSAAGVEQLKLSSGKYMLYAGDYDGSGIINNLDYNNWKVQGAVLNEYLPIDGDGNGIINVADYNLWIVNKAKVGTPIIRY